MRLIGLLVRDPNTYDDEGRTVWSQPTKNLVEGERQPMTKDEALEMADSVLVDAEVVDASVELSAGFRSFARDGRLRCHRSAIPRGRVGPHRGTMFPNSGGEGRTPPGHFT